MDELRKEDIEKYLVEINEALKEKRTFGEIVLAGGAALALMYDARDATKDIDAFFRPSKEMREIISSIKSHYFIQTTFEKYRQEYLPNNESLQVAEEKISKMLPQLTPNGRVDIDAKLAEYKKKRIAEGTLKPSTQNKGFHR